MLERFLSRKSKTFVTTLGVSTILLVGVIDYTTGTEISLTVFYILPVLAVAWYAGRRSGIVTSCFGTVAWLAADTVGPHLYSYTVIQYWNAATRLMIFLVVTFLVSRVRETLEREKQLARIDDLTNAANGRYFHEILEAERRRAERYNRPFTVAYMDIDNFKTVNDCRGHRTGDDLLRTVVQTIIRSTRSTDAVARLGGDEFAVLLPETGAEAATIVLRRVRDALLETFQKNEWPVTLSIGVMTFVKSPVNVNDILDQTDILMYSVKTKGKNGIRYAVKEEAVTSGAGERKRRER
ncbi:MAG TPA: diguanylate cyclase [Nitrospiria bacterium]|nr:diguanylate cyclase [Nitrospiria bacterium]